jgi:hypothetical protein
MVHMLNFWHVLRVKMPLHARHRYDHRHQEITHSSPSFNSHFSWATMNGRKYHHHHHHHLMMMNKESNGLYYATSQLLQSSGSVFTCGEGQCWTGTNRSATRQAGLDAVRQQNADGILLISRCLMFTHPLYHRLVARLKLCQLKSTAEFLSGSVQERSIPVQLRVAPFMTRNDR